jgi:hypothetical protein
MSVELRNAPVRAFDDGRESLHRRLQAHDGEAGTWVGIEIDGRPEHCKTSDWRSLCEICAPHARWVPDVAETRTAVRSPSGESSRVRPALRSYDVAMGRLGIGPVTVTWPDDPSAPILSYSRALAVRAAEQERDAQRKAEAAVGVEAPRSESSLPLRSYDRAIAARKAGAR